MYNQSPSPQKKVQHHKLSGYGKYVDGEKQQPPSVFQREIRQLLQLPDPDANKTIPLSTMNLRSTHQLQPVHPFLMKQTGGGRGQYDMGFVNERDEDFIDAEEDSPQLTTEEFKKLLKDVFKDYTDLVLESPQELFKTLNQRAFDSLPPEVTRKLYRHIKMNLSAVSQYAKILPTLELKVKSLPKIRSPLKKMKMSGITASLMHDSNQFASLKQYGSPPNALKQRFLQNTQSELISTQEFKRMENRSPIITKSNKKSFKDYQKSPDTQKPDNIFSKLRSQNSPNIFINDQEMINKRDSSGMSQTLAMGFSRNHNERQPNTGENKNKTVTSSFGLKNKQLAILPQNIQQQKYPLNSNSSVTPHSMHSRQSLQFPNLQFNASIKRSHFINSDPPEVKEEKKRAYNELLMKKVLNPKEIGLPSLYIRPETPIDPAKIDKEDMHYYTQVKETPRTMAGKIKKLIDSSFEEKSFCSDMSIRVGESLTKMLPKKSINQEKMMIQSVPQKDRFMKAYKHIDRINEIEEAEKDPDEAYNDHDAILEYVKETHKKKMAPHILAFKVRPNVQDMNSEEFDHEEIVYNLNGVTINNAFAEAFSVNLKYNNYLDIIVLNNNNLNDYSFEMMLKYLPSTVRKFNLTRNPGLTVKSYNLMLDVFVKKKFSLSHLILEGNECGDECCRVICDIVLKTKSIVILNLSKNSITCQGAEYLAVLLRRKDIRVQALLIHWNKILGRGSGILAKAIEDNSTLQIFDASFNSFGSSPIKIGNNFIAGLNNNGQGSQNKQPQISDHGTSNSLQEEQIQIDPFDALAEFEGFTISAFKWAKSLISNKTLIHVDFSFNNFKTPDIVVIGEGLKSNHTLLGIHLMGNEAKVDELGFVIPEKTMDSASFHVFTRIPQLLKTGQIGGKHKIELDVSSNCWICEGWSQMEFKLPRTHVELLLKDDDFRDKFKEKYGVACKVRVSLHMSYDGYKAHKMDFSALGTSLATKDSYIINRMVPPGKLDYFYSIQYSNDLPGEKRIPLTTTDKINELKYPEHLIVNSDKYQLDVPKLNYVSGDIELLNKILDLDDIYGMIAKPRPEKTSTPRPKTPWTFEKSFFTQYVDNNEQVMVDCFEFDWMCCKIEKWLERGPKTQRDTVYNYLKTNYKHIHEAYKYLSALSPSGKYWSIGTNVFSETIFACNNFIDYVTLKHSDVDLEFIATKASGSSIGYASNPERQLIRYQFLEILVRLALAKLFKTNRNTTQEHAIIYSFDHHMLPFFKQFDFTQFRHQKLYNEGCDIVIKKHMQALQDIYKKYSGKEAIGGEERFMSLQEFIDLVTSTQVVDDNFGVREINTIFRVSLATQVDEIRYDRHTRMMFLEFVEAIARVADRVVQFLVAGDDDRQHGTALTQSSGIHLPTAGLPGTADQLEQIEEELNIDDQDSNIELSSGRLSINSDNSDVRTIGAVQKMKKTKKDPLMKTETNTTASLTPRGFKGKSKRKRDIKSNTAAYNNSIGMDMKLQEYIRKISLLSMGQEYAYNFIRKFNLQSQAFLYYSSWTSGDNWIFKQLGSNLASQGKQGGKSDTLSDMPPQPTINNSLSNTYTSGFNNNNPQNNNGGSAGQGTASAGNTVKDKMGVALSQKVKTTKEQISKQQQK